MSGLALMRKGGEVMSRSREPKLRNFELNREKFEELIVYIAERCADDPTYDTFKLNTMLYYADFAAYRMFGEPNQWGDIREVQRRTCSEAAARRTPPSHGLWSGQAG